MVAPVARGASGGLVGADNSLMEVPGQRLTLAYTQGYPEAVNEAFAKLAGSREEFFQETGSIRDFPGSLTLLKRLVYEELVRPQLLAGAAGSANTGRSWADILSATIISPPSSRPATNTAIGCATAARAMSAANPARPARPASW